MDGNAIQGFRARLAYGNNWHRIAVDSEWYSFSAPPRSPRHRVVVQSGVATPFEFIPELLQLILAILIAKQFVEEFILPRGEKVREHDVREQEGHCDVREIFPHAVSVEARLGDLLHNVHHRWPRPNGLPQPLEEITIAIPQLAARRPELSQRL